MLPWVLRPKKYYHLEIYSLSFKGSTLKASQVVWNCYTYMQEMRWNKADKELTPMKKREGEFQMVTSIFCLSTRGSL